MFKGQLQEHVSEHRGISVCFLPGGYALALPHPLSPCLAALSLSSCL